MQMGICGVGGGRGVLFVFVHGCAVQRLAWLSSPDARPVVLHRV